MSRGGFPDLLAVKKGITYYFEVKALDGVVSALQQNTIYMLNIDRKIAFVVYSFNEFIKIWESL
jgi:hypothetical protein